ncbi:MAG: hypothetical protein AAFO77_03900 [Pseudomonadota bacterium]
MRTLMILAFGAALIHSPLVQAQPLTQSEIAEELVGRDLSTKRRGMTVTLTLSPDGTVQVRAPLGRVNGNWSFSGDQICMTIAMRGREQSNCTTYERVGQGIYRNAQGDMITVR